MNTFTTHAGLYPMKHRITYTLLFLPLLFVLFCGQSAAYAQAQDDVLELLRARYNTVEFLRAAFTQKTTSPFGEDLPVNRGTILLQGDNYRVETDVQTFVTNGVTTWVYDAYQNQVLVNDFVDDEATFSISNFLRNFDQEYEVLESSVTYLDGARHEIVRMASLVENAFFKEVSLTIRATDHIITRLTVIDVNDASLDFTLDDIEINPEISGDPFDFIPPNDAEVIDLRS